LRLVHGREYAINEIPGDDDDAPDVDLSLDAVAVCLLTTAPPGRAQCPRRRGGISSEAQELEFATDPSAVRYIVIVIDAFDIPAVLPCWRGSAAGGREQGYWQDARTGQTR